MNTILTDDERRLLSAAMTGKPEDIRAIEAAVLAKLREQEPVAMRYDFDGYGYRYIDSGSGSDWRTRIPDAEAVYAAPLPAVVQVPQGWKLVPVEPTDEMVEAAWESDAVDYVGEHKRIWRADMAFKAMLAAAPEAPPQRCTNCDDTGDVHDQTGEWRGRCHCPAGREAPVQHTFASTTPEAPAVAQVPQNLAALLDDVIDHAWSDGVLRKDKLMDDRTLAARQKLLNALATAPEAPAQEKSNG